MLVTSAVLRGRKCDYVIEHTSEKGGENGQINTSRVSKCHEKISLDEETDLRLY
jgi:hypothetical protein